jgi:hypothetical protein
MNYSIYLAQSFLALLLTTLSCGASAATLSYVLDQSNTLPDHVDYLTVTLSDDVEGQVDFWVDARSPLTDIAGENFGIQKFSFHVGGDLLSGGHPGHDRDGDEPPGIEVAREHREFGMSEAHRNSEAGRWSPAGEAGEEPHGMLDSLLTADAFLLPDGWRVQLDRGGRHGEDGYNVRLLGTGHSRQDPLHFSVLGLALEDVLAGFSAHVAGFEFTGDGCGEGEHRGEEGNGCRVITSAYFSGDRPVVVPLPATAWLLGSGLLGLVGCSRRRRA